jgi:hypothetical protein
MHHLLPFTTFGEMAALGLKAKVYCPSCYEHRPNDPAAEHLRDRCFATTRFRSLATFVCSCARSIEIEPSVLLQSAAKTHWLSKAPLASALLADSFAVGSI